MLLGQTKHKERSRPIDTQKSSQNPKKIPNEELYINYYLQNSKAMSKLLKKDHSPLKFDTSSANINCFIRPPSKQKQDDHNHHLKNHKHKQKACNQSQKQIEFQDKAFLESVVSKILTEADCPGITELIDNMVFPSTNSGQAEASRDNRREQLQQQQISQIFSNHYPFNRVNYPQKANLFEQSSHFYRINPSQYHTYRDEKPEMTTTVQTSFNSHSPSSRNLDTNPETEMFNAMNSNLPIGYPYSYYPQLNYLYQRQQSSRKRRVVTGQQANEYRIIPEKIQSDFRTTLMIRHIPNKYSQDMLLEQIGKNHRMHINFLYLPIDHSNACNVGYAFANFIHAKFIFEFYQEFNGRRWDRFNSEKICQLAYARIQGTTNLMDHFQNSSNGQLRGRTLSKGEEKKKTAVELDENAIKGITEIVSHQRVEYN